MRTSQLSAGGEAHVESHVLGPRARALAGCTVVWARRKGEFSAACELSELGGRRVQLPASG